MDNTFTIDACKALIMGLLVKCRPHTKEIIWKLIQLLSQYPSSTFSIGDMADLLGDKISASALDKLVEHNILIKIDGDPHKMLVDGISPPAYGRDAIAAMKFANHKALLDDAKNRLEIQNIIFTIFGEYNITDWPSSLTDFMKIYNKIIDMIIDQDLYNNEFGYGKLSWRPQKANKYILNIEYLKMFVHTQKTTLQRAIKTSIVKK